MAEHASFNPDRLDSLVHCVRSAIDLQHTCPAQTLGASLPATVFTAVDTMQVPAQALAPADARDAVAAEVARINKERFARARAELERATETLAAAGWKVKSVVTDGAPLRDLLRVVSMTRADLLIVGARGVSG